MWNSGSTTGKFLPDWQSHVAASEQTTDITTAIDKLDKIGMEKVKEELLKKIWLQTADWRD